MPVTSTGFIETEAMLVEMDTTVKRRCVASLHRKAVEIAALARKYAPLDEANLEKAIKVFPETLPTSRLRNERGQFIRQDVFVYVDGEMAVPGRPGKKVGDYAYRMHEHLAPFGPLNLGEKSQEKQARQPEMVGGKYLERAAVELTQSIMADVSDSILSLFDY